jgi:hypothetical protein
LSALRHGTRARAAARLAEGLLLGFGVYLCLTALAVSDGHAPASTAVLFSASLASCCAALTWGLAHRRSVTQVAEDLSQLVGMPELSAVCQTQGASPEPLAELAARRVLMRVPPRRLWRLALPDSWPLLLAPLVGGVLLSLVSEMQPEILRATVAQGTMEVVRAGASAAADQVLTAVSEGRLSQDVAQDALGLAQEARGIDTQLAGPEDLERLSDWLEDAGALEGRVAGEPAAQEALAQARRAGEAALMAMTAGRDQDSSAVAQGDLGRDSVENGREVSGAGTSSSQPTLQGQTPAPKEGTIPGPQQPAEGGSSSLPPVGPKKGVLDSARDARLVQHWLEHLKNQ